MIDSTTEDLIPLTQAAAELPRRRGGKATSISTLYRWSLEGCRGIQLETIQCGATRCTSREALQRFYAALSEAEKIGGTPSGVRVGSRFVAATREKAEKAGKVLEELGA